MIFCNNHNCKNTAKVNLTLEYDNNLIVEIKLCDECSDTIENTEIFNSSFSQLN